MSKIKNVSLIALGMMSLLANGAPIPLAPGIQDSLDNRELWTKQMVINHVMQTVNDPGIGFDVPTRDNSAKTSNLAYQSHIPEKLNNFSGELDLYQISGPIQISILADDKAVLHVTSKDGFDAEYKLDGTALWNKKSFKMFDVLLPGNKKYQLNLTYHNTANLTNSPAYAGKVDVDGVNVYLSSVQPDVLVRFADGRRSGSVVLNDDDDNDNEEWDYLDTKQTITDDDDLVKFIVRTGYKEGTLRIAVEFGGEKVKVWADRNKKNQHSMTWNVTGGKIKHTDTSPAGRSDYKVNGMDGDVGYFYIEGVSKSFNWEDITIKASIDSAVDRAYVSVLSTDIDVDSDNNEAYEHLVATPYEDKIEDSEKHGMDGWTQLRPGKLVYFNKGYTDGVPDWADGFDVNKSSPEDDLLEDSEFKFVAITLTKPTMFDDDCTVSFGYSGSAPSLVHVSPVTKADNSVHQYSYANLDTGKLRIWNKPANRTRDMKSVADSGNYVPVNRNCKWSELDVDGDSTDHFVTLYMEGVSPSDSFGDIPIKCTITKNHTSNSGESYDATASDTVKVTVIDITAEPVTVDVSLGDKYVDNSSCVGNTVQYYTIQSKPNFPVDKIEWSASLNWQIFGDGVGQGALMKSLSMGNGYAYAAIDGGYAKEVQHTGYSNPNMKIIPVSVHVLTKVNSVIQPTKGVLEVDADNDTILEQCISDADVDKALSKANEIFMQAGIKFVKKDNKIVKLKNNKLYRPTPLTDDECREITRFHGPNENEIELYFIKTCWNSVEGQNYISEPGFENDGGSLITTTNNFTIEQRGVIVAHELGHALGLDDIYEKYVDGTTGNIVSFEPELGHVRSNMPDDWTIQTPITQGYHKDSARHQDLIPKMLMYGNPLTSPYLDIPFSEKIKGFRRSYLPNGTFTLVPDQVKVGLKEIIANGYKTNH